MVTHKNYACSVTLKMLAAYYSQQTCIMSRLLPKGLYRWYCIVKAAVCPARRNNLLILPYLELCITPRCSLKCVNCANLMQYYENPKDYDIEQIFAAVDRLLSCVDLIDCFRILGGEPFMHKDIARIICYCVEHGKIVQVQVVTNGTIIPKEEVLKVLEHKKASVYISDYETVSVSRKRLEKCLSGHGIVHFSDSNYIWDDMGGLDRRDYSTERVRTVYQGCRDICKTLVDGVVYICPRSAHGDKLGIIPVNDHDHVDIFAGSVAEVRRKLRALFDVEYIEACYYCNAVEDRGKIVAGEQCSAAQTKHESTNAG
jgi:organic radical activating enzyme